VGRLLGITVNGVTDTPVADVTAGMPHRSASLGQFGDGGDVLWSELWVPQRPMIASQVRNDD
jgi:hypothetical protein